MDAARPLEPDRVPAPAVRANKAARPTAPEQILELIGGQRIRQRGLIRHTPPME